MSAHACLRFGTSRIAAALFAAALAAGCAGASPEVKVLGVSQGRAVAPQGTQHAVVLFLEVINPSGRPLDLSRLDYRLSAPDWLDASGRVRLSRAIGPGASTIVEIPVPLEQRARHAPAEVSYVLEGTLFARDNHVERSWPVAARGSFGEESAGGRAREPVVVRVAAHTGH